MCAMVKGSDAVIAQRAPNATQSDALACQMEAGMAFGYTYPDMAKAIMDECSDLRKLLEIRCS